MPAPDFSRPGTPCWIELFTSDPDASRAFYNSLFGWTADEPNQDFGGYFMFRRDGAMVSGGMRNDGQQGMPDAWSIYLTTDDAEQVAKATTANGGGTIVPPMEIADLGSMVFVTDPGGAAIGGWQSANLLGFEVVGEAGAPAWFELLTRDYDASVAFYRDVFGWDPQTAAEQPDFRYTTLGEGRDSQAGIMDASPFLPEGAPGQWSIYFSVENADATLAQITALGGTVVQPAEDTPYGRLATATDPTGATFKLLQRL